MDADPTVTVLDIVDGLSEMPKYPVVELYNL